MKINDILNEKVVPIVSDKPIAKKLRNYRGINFLVLGEREPPDVHGIPKELEAYGRGGFEKDGSIFIDGGPSGSSQGHPETITNGFYWGADYDKAWEFNGEQKKGVIYVRGRAGTDEKLIERNIFPIMDIIFKRLPRP